MLLRHVRVEVEVVRSEALHFFHPSRPLAPVEIAVKVEVDVLASKLGHDRRVQAEWAHRERR